MSGNILQGVLSTSLGIRWSDLRGGDSNTAHFDRDFRLSVDDAELLNTPMVVLDVNYASPFSKYFFWGLGLSASLSLTDLEGSVDTDRGAMSFETSAKQYNIYGSLGLSLPLGRSRLGLSVQGGVTYESLTVSTTIDDCFEEDNVVSFRPTARIRGSWMFSKRTGASGLAFGFYGSFEAVSRTPEVGIQISISSSKEPAKRVPHPRRTAVPLTNEEAAVAREALETDSEILEPNVLESPTSCSAEPREGDVVVVEPEEASSLPEPEHVIPVPVY